MSLAGPGAGRTGASRDLPVAAAGFVIGLLLSAVGSSLAGSATGYRAGTGASTPLGVTIGGVLGLWVGLVGAVIVAARRSGEHDLRRYVGLRVAGARDLVGGAMVGLASQYVLIPVLYLPAEAVDPSLAHQLSKPAQQDTAAVHGTVAITLLIMVLALGAPVVEEMFFRGLVLRGLAARHRPMVAVSVTAVLFATAHFEAVQFAGLAAFGVILGALARRFGRLGPSIAAHAAFNAAAVLSLLHSR